MRAERWERRPPYPICPLCGGEVVGAMMTSHSVEVDGVLYYHPDAVSVYCCNAACNYDRLLPELPYPPPGDEAIGRLLDTLDRKGAAKEEG